MSQNFEFALLLISETLSQNTAGHSVVPESLFIHVSIHQQLFPGFMLVPCQNVVIALAISILSLWVNMLLIQSDNVLIDQECNLTLSASPLKQ